MTPIKHGIYSGIKREGFQERLERFRALADPLDLHDEIAMLRAFLEEFIDRWDKIYGPDGALLAWHESFVSEEVTPKPRQMPDFATLTLLVDRVGKMAERVHKMQQKGSISLGTMERYVEQLGIEVVEAIREANLDQDQSEKLLGGIEDRWRSIKLDAGRNSN